METAIVQAAMRSGTGTQDFTSAGFGTPQVAIFFLARGYTNGTAANHAVQAFGAADGTTEFCAACRSENNQTIYDASRWMDDGHCIVVLDPTDGTVGASASFTQWITDGIRVTWDVQGLVSFPLIQCLLINDLVDVSVDILALTGDSDTATEVTTLGFQPDTLIVVGTDQQALNTADDEWRYSLGFVDASGSVSQSSVCQSRGEGFTVRYPRVSATATYGNHYRTGLDGTTTLQVQFSDFDADGYTATARNSVYSGTTHYLGVISLAHGLSVSVGVWSGPSQGISGNHSLVKKPVTPTFGMVAETMAEALDTVYSNVQGEPVGLGVFNATQEYSIETRLKNGVYPSRESSLVDTVCLHMRRQSDDWAVAEFVSMDAGGWTWNWTTNLSYLNDMPKMPYLAIGGPYVPPSYSTDPLNIEVVNDIIDWGLQAGYLPGIGVTNFQRSAFHIDTDDRDGAVTYVHEIVATNKDTSDHDITLHTTSWDDNPSVTVSTITVLANTTSPKVFTATFTPTDGLHYYNWTVPMVGAYRSLVELYDGRYRVTQIQCTKLVVYRPLCDWVEGETEHYYQQFGSTWLSYTQTDQYVPCPGAGAWIYDPDLYTAENITYTIEVNVGSSVHGGAIDFCLWDMNDDLLTDGTEFSVYARAALSAPHASLGTFTFSPTAIQQDGRPLLDPDHVYRLYWKNNAVTGLDFLSVGKMYGARLYQKLGGCEKVTVYYRVARKVYGFSGDITNTSRVQINIMDPAFTKYIAAFMEVCGMQIYGYSDWWLLNDDSLLTGDGSAATRVTDTDVRFYYPPQYSYHYPQFSTPLTAGTLVDGDYYFGEHDPGDDVDSPRGSILWQLVSITYVIPDDDVTEPYTPPTGTEDSTGYNYTAATLLWAKDLMDERSGWFQDIYTPAINVHYGDEGDGVNGTLLGGDDGGVYLLSGLSDNGTAIDCQVLSPSRDQGDPRFWKLYDDMLIDLDTNGVNVSVTPRFNNMSNAADPTTLTNSVRTKVPISVKDTSQEGKVARNIAADFTWSSASAKPYLYAWEPRLTESAAKVSAYSWETSWLTHNLPGYFYHGWLYLVHLSTVDLTFDILNPDETAAASVTVAFSGTDYYAKTFVRLPVVKGKVYKYKLSCSSEFFVNGDQSELLVKPWGVGGPWHHARIFQDIAMGDAA